VTVNERRAIELVARERARIESLLAEQSRQVRADASLGRQQTGESADSGTALEAEAVSVALQADLRDQLAAVVLAEGRIALGTYGISVDSGKPIPDERLEAEPLALRTVEEQRRFEQHGAPAAH
jgi:DnaK suppressor protein